MYVNLTQKDTKDTDGKQCGDSKMEVYRFGLRQHLKPSSRHTRHFYTTMVS